MLAVSFAVVTTFGFSSAVQKQLRVAVSGSLASSVSLHVVLIGTGFDVPPCRSEERRVGKECRARLPPDTVKKKSAVPPVFWAKYCTCTVSASNPLPSTVTAFQHTH